MSSAKKKALWIAGVLMLAGALLLCGVLVAARFDFSRLNTVHYQTSTYSVEQEFSNIHIDIQNADVVFDRAPDGQARVVCTERAPHTASVTVRDGTLTVSQPSVESAKWYQHIYVYFGQETEQIKIYLPDQSFAELRVHTTSGDVTVPEDTVFDQIYIETSAGNVKVSAAAAKSEIDAKTSSGNLNAYGTNHALRQLQLSSGSGDIVAEDLSLSSRLTMRTQSGELRISRCKVLDLSAESTSGDISVLQSTIQGSGTVETRSGDVRFAQAEIGTLGVTTQSGDVTGSLATPMTYETHTNSGSVTVPKNGHGGQCTITTQSGDILLR